MAVNLNKKLEILLLVREFIVKTHSEYACIYIYTDMHVYIQIYIQRDDDNQCGVKVISKA